MAITSCKEGKIFSKITPGRGDRSPNLYPILFVHAAVADHTMWDGQVEFLCDKGFTCIQYDLLGFGLSQPDQNYFKVEENKVDHIQHMLDLIVANLPPQQPQQAIVVGLSMGAGLALRLATLHPELVCGAVIAAGNVPGYDGGTWDPKEGELDDQIVSTIAAGDIEKAAKLQVHFWGDGPLQPEGRFPAQMGEKLYKWCLENSRREYEKTGAFALPAIRRPPVSEQALVDLEMPIAVAIGEFDEVATKDNMEYLAKTANNVNVRHFETAHMINLEQPREFNEWLYAWLEEKFHQVD